MLLRNASIISVAMLALSALSACSGVSVEKPEPFVTDQNERIAQQYGTIHGEEGFLLFGRSRGAENGDAGPTMPVNPYLWRAALETIDFMPLAQTDPLGGVIITDWYSPPETRDERFKLTVYVRDRALRADGLKVSVFRQVRGDTGGWVDAAVEPGAATGIQNNILTRARELRVASLGPVTE